MPLFGVRVLLGHRLDPIISHKKAVDPSGSWQLHGRVHVRQQQQRGQLATVDAERLDLRDGLRLQELSQVDI